MRLITNKTNPNYTINSILHARFHCVFTLPMGHSGTNSEFKAFYWEFSEKKILGFLK